VEESSSSSEGISVVDEHEDENVEEEKKDTVPLHKQTTISSTMSIERILDNKV